MRKEQTRIHNGKKICIYKSWDSIIYIYIIESQFYSINKNEFLLFFFGCATQEERRGHILYKCKPNLLHSHTACWILVPLLGIEPAPLAVKAQSLPGNSLKVNSWWIKDSNVLRKTFYRWPRNQGAKHKETSKGGKKSQEHN